jgi:hypothetical protein
VDREARIALTEVAMREERLLQAAKEFYQIESIDESMPVQPDLASSQRESRLRVYGNGGTRPAHLVVIPIPGVRMKRDEGPGGA